MTLSESLNFSVPQLFPLYNDDNNIYLLLGNEKF